MGSTNKTYETDLQHYFKNTITRLTFKNRYWDMGFLNFKYI